MAKALVTILKTAAFFMFIGFFGGIIISFVLDYNLGPIIGFVYGALGFILGLAIGVLIIIFNKIKKTNNL